MQKSNLIYKLKGIAILCVICAHCGNRVSYSQMDLLMDQIRNSIAGFGVPLFLIISGYLYNNKKSFSEFWRTKFKTTIIPWIFWGTVVWGYQVIRKGLAYAKLLEWLWGMGTYLWFMRTIILIWILVYFVKNRKSKIVLFAVACSARIMMSHIIDSQITSDVLKQLLTNLPYFMFGMVIKEINIGTNNLFERYLFGKDIKKYIIRLTDNKVCGYLNEKLIFYGKYSYIIYLIHMPVAGLISNLFSRSSILLYFVLVQPIIVAIIVKYMIKILQVISDMLPWTSIIIGMPSERNRRQE